MRELLRHPVLARGEDPGKAKRQAQIVDGHRARSRSRLSQRGQHVRGAAEVVEHVLRLGGRAGHDPVLNAEGVSGRAFVVT
jgi:hypothetical protein